VLIGIPSAVRFTDYAFLLHIPSSELLGYFHSSAHRGLGNPQSITRYLFAMFFAYDKHQ